ncbi:MAG: hypothetical protein WDN08_22040 [Rhizomicrobium sp.]
MNIARVAAIAAIVILPQTASAGSRDDVIAGMARCAAVAENAARLACYDALNPAVKAAQAEPPAPATAAPPPIAAVPPPAVATVPPPPAETADNRSWYDPGRIFGVSPRQQTTPEQFGSENLNAPPPPAGAPATPAPPAALDSITAGVTDYSFNYSNKFLVILDNGQIWQQLPGDADRARFNRNGKNTVTIERGLFGSYNLTINDSSQTFKVKRLK